MKLADAKALLPEIRFVIETASVEWAESYDPQHKRSQICGRDGLSGLVYPIATLDPSIASDDREILRKAPVYIRALLLLRDEAVRQYRAVTAPANQDAAEPSPGQGGDANRYAKACAILSGKHPFRQYLQVRHGLDAVDEERVNTRVRSILNIQSRNELDADPDARERWFSLVKDYESWTRPNSGARERPISPRKEIP